jgi:hypothetical protein
VDCNELQNRAIEARISSAVLVHTRGLGSWLLPTRTELRAELLAELERGRDRPLTLVSTEIVDGVADATVERK